MGVFDKGLLNVKGDIAHDAADSGSPLKLGGKALGGRPTKVAANDRVNGWYDLRGRLYVSNGMHGDLAASSGSVAAADDLAFATAITGAYAAVSTANLAFDGGNWATGHAANYYQVPMLGFRILSFAFYNNLGVDAQLTIYNNLYFGTTPAAQGSIHVFNLDTVVSGNTIHCGPYAAGISADSDYYCVPALANPVGSWLIVVNPVSQPGSGEIRLYASRA